MAIAKRAPLTLTLVVVLATACGSTVRTGASDGLAEVAAAAGSGLELTPTESLDGGEPDVVDTDAAGSAGSVATGGTTAPSIGLPRAEPVPEDAGDSARGGSGPAPAVTEGPAPQKPPIEVGIQINENAGSAYRALGFEVDAGDSRAQAEALVSDINGRGGLGGRQIEPVFYVADVADMQTTPDQKMQEACAEWTQDHDVEVAASALAVTEVLLKCLAEARVPFTLAPGGGFDDSQYRVYGPYLSAPVEPSLTRWAPAIVERLVAQPFFGDAPKIGVIHIDNPKGHLTRQALHDALSRHGMEVSEDFAFSEAGDEALAQLQSAVLQFKSAGVTHVLPILPGGGGVVFFMLAAEKQQFRPLYGLSSHDAGGALLQGSVPRAQLRGARGMGWNPNFDVDEARDPGLTSSGKRCKALMEEAGQDMSSRVARWSAFALCDVLWELEGAFRGASATDPDTFLTGLYDLGDEFVPAATFRSRFGPDRPDGAAAVRDLFFDDSCGCFRYDGPLRPF